MAFVMAGALTAATGVAAQASTPIRVTYDIYSVNGARSVLIEEGVQESRLEAVPGLGVTTLAIRRDSTASRTSIAATAAAGNIYQCYSGTSPRQSTTFINPTTSCQSYDYWILTANYQPVWHNAGVRGDSPLWTAVRTAYWAVQNWCSQNSATCGVITTVGSAILFKKLK